MTQLQSKGGRKLGYKLDTASLINLQRIPDFLEEEIGIRPSHATIIRRSIRLYSQHLDELQEANKLILERDALLLAAGRLN